MIDMKKILLIFGAITISFLMISSATAVQNINNKQYLKTNEQIFKIKENIKLRNDPYDFPIFICVILALIGLRLGLKGHLLLMAIVIAFMDIIGCPMGR